MTSKFLTWCLELTKEDEYAKAALMLSALVMMATIWWNLKRRMSEPEKASLPPGPWGLPLVGNLPFLDPNLHRCLAQLALKYGPIMKIQLGLRLCVVFSSPESAKEVLKEQDVNFADRDVTSVIYSASYGASNMAFSPYGQHWRMMRRVCSKELLSPGRLEALSSLRRREIQGMVKTMYSKIGTSIDIGEHVLVAMFSTITSMMWGNTVDEEQQVQFTIMFQTVVYKLVKLLGDANISDLYPALAQYDIQGKVGQVKEILVQFDQIFESILNTRRQMNHQDNKETKNKDRENKDFLQVLLNLVEQQDQNTPFTTTHLKALFVDMTVAGPKTTSTTVEWAMAELMNNSEILKNVQEELEQVVGLNNVVEEIHLPELRYLDAVIKEVLRLHPPAPFLIPRCPVKDCTVGGYLIPKGCKIFVNAWAIQRDAKYWINPLEFQPERFMDSSNQWDYNGNDFSYIPFGSGRRICVGISVAEKSLSFLLATLVHSFNWRLPEGTKLELSDEFGMELKKTVPLRAIPTPRLLLPNLYDL